MAIEAAALGAGVLAYASKDVVTKLLGPTAEYLGGELRDFVTRRQQIAGRIFQNAATKAASRLDQPGCVPPHVLKDVISDGTFQDNDFAVEYFGGVLASSRTEVDRDDSAATYSAMLARMSAYQIRAHYIFYSIFKLLYDGKDAQISQGKFRARMRTYVSYKSFALGMEFTKAELEKFDVIISHVLYGLLKEDLIGERYQAGNPATLSVPDVEEGWIVLDPTVPGAELFMRAHGVDYRSVNEFLLPDRKMGNLQPIPIRPPFKPAKEWDA